MTTTTDPNPAAVDQDALGALVGQAVSALGSILNGALVVIGDRLGLYGALAAGGSQTPDELATRTETTERTIREWLSAQTAAGYVTYDGGGRFSLSPEQTEAMVKRGQSRLRRRWLPGHGGGGPLGRSAHRVVSHRRRHGMGRHGMGWDQHEHDLFHGTQRFFRPGYLANLVQSWIPALTGIDARLRAGGSVADIGCGLGSSTILMAQAYPESTFVGFDFHRPSIEAARAAAVKNLNPIGRVFYAASTLIRTPASQAQEVGRALGAQAGETRLRQVTEAAGLTQFRRATETPFNLVLEARR